MKLSIQMDDSSMYVRNKLKHTNILQVGSSTEIHHVSCLTTNRGKFQIESIDGGGTRVICMVPFSTAAGIVKH